LADTVLVANNVTAASIREIWVCRIGFIFKLISFASIERDFAVPAAMRL